MKLATLYKRAKTGKIQYWNISTRGGWIHKESGQLGTSNPVRHQELAERKNVGKANEVSIEEQAIRQAESDWRKKRDEGYKSLGDLGITEIGKEGDTGHLTDLLGKLLPKFNTDASGNVKPMLATDWKKVKKIDYPVIVQPKLDGVRCLMVVNEPEVKFLTRSGKEYTTLGHIANAIFDAYSNGVLKGNFILDGEIYSEEISFQEICQAVKKQYSNSLKLRFQAYDIITDSSQEDRIVAESRDIVTAIGSDFVTMVPYAIVEDEASVRAYHDQWVREGYEGAMIRTLSGKYEQGTKSRTLLKVKEFNENEFTFLRWETGQRDEDLIAVLGNQLDMKEFRAKMEGNRAYKEELRQTAPKRITVKHFGWTDDGLPRSPIGKAIRDYE